MSNSSPGWSQFASGWQGDVMTSSLAVIAASHGVHHQTTQPIKLLVVFDTFTLLPLCLALWTADQVVGIEAFQAVIGLCT